MRNFSKQNPRKPIISFQSPRARKSVKMLVKNDKKMKEEWIKVGAYKYREKDLLGKGFSSQVFCGTQINDGSAKFAIKVINIDKFKAANLPILDNEIRIHQCLDHPHIIKCYDFYKTQQYYYIVMEYCSHGDLERLLQKKKFIQQKRAIEIINQVISGYRYLISIGVFHRDLKPANIMKCGNTWKIGDFGFSTICKKEYLLDSINVGTPLYMAPESLSMNKYSIKTDIFAVGIILFEMLTGNTPWECKTQKQLLNKMKKQKIHIPQKIKNKKIIEFIEKACETDEFKRLSKDKFSKILQEKKQKVVKDERSGGSLNLTLRKYSSPLKQVKKSEKNYQQTKKLIKTSHSDKQDIKSQLSEVYQKNTQKVIQQLGYCKQIYDILSINDKFLLEKAKQDFFCFSLFKYLIRNLKSMENLKLNPLKLEKWQLYKSTPEFLKIYSEIKIFSKQCQIQYSQKSKNIKDTILKGINRRFPQLSFTSVLTNNFYSNFKIYIIGVLKSMNKQIRKNKEDFTNLISSYKNLASLFNFYVLIEAKATSLKEKSKKSKPKEQIQVIFDSSNEEQVKIVYEKICEKIKFL